MGDVPGSRGGWLSLTPAWTRGEDERRLWEAFYQRAPRRLHRDPGELAERWAEGAAAAVRERGLPALALDLGCGAGQDLSVFQAAGLAAVGLDLSLRALRAAGAERASPPPGSQPDPQLGFPTLPIHRVAADLRRPLPFSDGAFGVVYSRFVLSGDFDDAAAAAAVAEVGRVLAPGGLLLLAVRSTDDPTYRACGQPPGGAARCGGQGLRFYSRRRLRSLLQNYEIVEISARLGEGDLGVGALEAVAVRPGWVRPTSLAQRL